ncbi:MAG: hypothetical protein GQ527_08145 [Bacteroidales bacterium]|nr:hypothetical protein [Bacteroidales bacterium]
MGLDQLEKTIKNNQEYFDKEPSMDHMDKFLFKIREQEEEKPTSFLKWEKSSWWIGVAASISLLLTISWFIMQQPIQQSKQQMGISMELYEIKSYYNSESDKKMDEINNCANNSSETKKLIETTESELMKISFNVEKIENRLKEAAGNKKLELAYIQSLKAKNDLVNKMHSEICINDNNITQ